MARGEMPFSHDGFHDRVKRYPIPHLSAAEFLGLGWATKRKNFEGHKSKGIIGHNQWDFWTVGGKSVIATLSLGYMIILCIE